NGNRGKDINEVDGRHDRGLREICESREQRIEAPECPAWTATARHAGLQPEPWLAPEARNGIAGVGSHRPRTDIARSKVSQLKYAFDIVVPRRRSAPHTRTERVARLVSDAGIERRIPTNDAEIVEIDIEARNRGDRHTAVHAPEDL